MQGAGRLISEQLPPSPWTSAAASSAGQEGALQSERGVRSSCTRSRWTQVEGPAPCHPTQLPSQVTFECLVTGNRVPAWGGLGWTRVDPEEVQLPLALASPLARTQPIPRTRPALEAVHLVGHSSQSRSLESR